MTPPPLIVFPGDWPPYEADLYRVFRADLLDGGLEFRALPVRCRRLPEANGRWASFWHLIQTGPVEDDRLPDLRRCERLRWVRWTITNGDSHADIDAWHNKRENEDNVLLWYKEQYLVVLAQRKDYWLLKTAYCTDRSGRVRQLRRERDAYQSLISKS